MDKDKIKDFYLHQIEMFGNSNVNSLLKDIRDSAYDDFKSSTFPTKKNEDWKYTDVTPLLLKKFSRIDGVIDNINLDNFYFNNFPNNLIVFVDGIFSQSLSKFENDNFIIENLANLSFQNQELLKKYFSDFLSKKNIFTLMNAVFVNDGLFIFIPDNTNIDIPLQILYLNGKSKNALITPKNYFYIGKNSSLRIIVNNKSFNNHLYFANDYFDVMLDKNSKLDFYNIQNENAFHYSYTKFLMNFDSKLTHFSISLDGKFIRNDIVSELNGENIECNLNGLYLAKSDNLVDNHTEIIHSKPNSMSNEIYKGIMTDKSHGVFNGKIFVSPNAQKTNSFQSNKNILLSKNAKVDTKPQLEIFADDVKCSHGATVGTLDEQAKFYIKSRGISEKVAEKMLLKAFACEIIEKINIKEIQKHLSKEISNLVIDKNNSEI
ncbi:MAG: Fe-S cluster assembly protein SufD [Ignavibacteriales bacterium]|nr:Fe-S cluster assembly protein SufD [Ignavibacteriales bacterium]